jgi:hypothetical protein
LPSGTSYVAAVDVAGPAEDPSDADSLLRATLPRKDSTVVLIAQVTRMADGPSRGPALAKIVQAYWWTGRPLHEQCDRLVSLLKDTWKCRRVAVDASGLGADLAARLQKALGATVVEPFVFTAPSKSDLAYSLLAHVSSGRLQMWSEQSPSPEATEFWREVERARPIHRSEGKLGFYVPEHYGHDDFLVALALCSRAAQSATAFPEPAHVILRPNYRSSEENYERRYGSRSWRSRIASWLDDDSRIPQRPSPPPPTPEPDTTTQGFDRRGRPLPEPIDHDRYFPRPPDPPPITILPPDHVEYPQLRDHPPLNLSERDLTGGVQIEHIREIDV